MPTKPESLTTEELADARRLKAHFEAHQARLKDVGLPWSQDALSDHLGFNQSALNQYINGKIKLNADALFAFCRLLVIDPAAVSPRLVEEVRKKRAQWNDPTSLQYSSPALYVAQQLDEIKDPQFFEKAHAKALRAIAVVAKESAKVASPARRESERSPAKARVASARGTVKPIRAPALRK